MSRNWPSADDRAGLPGSALDSIVTTFVEDHNQDDLRGSEIDAKRLRTSTRLKRRLSFRRAATLAGVSDVIAIRLQASQLPYTRRLA